MTHPTNYNVGFQKGHIPWNKGIVGFVMTDEIRKKISDSTKGMKKPWLKGKIATEETRKKMSESHKGFKHTEESKQKMSEMLKLSYKDKTKHHNFGKKLSKETRMKISKSHIGLSLGSKAGAWKGGISFFPYSLDWNHRLRESIRVRDDYTCQLCGKEQGKESLSVHHIDKNKFNSDPNNLISLCRKCHSQTNTEKEYWIMLFKGVIDENKTPYKF